MNFFCHLLSEGNIEFSPGEKSVICEIWQV